MVGQQSREVWTAIGGNQEEILSIDKFAGFNTKKKKIQKQGRASAEKQGETGGTLTTFTGRNRNENVFARPNGLRENAETATSFGGPEPGTKMRYTSNRGEEEEYAQISPCGKTVE